LQLDPNQTHANDVFPLSNDGNGGTDVQVLAKSNAGFDSSPAPTNLSWLWANTNLSWLGYYLAPAPAHCTDLSWMSYSYQTLHQQQGWNVAPLYVGYQDPNVDPTNGIHPNHLSSNENSVTVNFLALHGAASAAAYLNSEGFPKFTTVYFDLEPFTNQSQNGQISSVEATYITEWCNDIRLFGYLPGIYFNTKTSKRLSASASGWCCNVGRRLVPARRGVNLTAHRTTRIYSGIAAFLIRVTLPPDGSTPAIPTRTTTDGPVYLDLDTSVRSADGCVQNNVATVAAGNTLIVAMLKLVDQRSTRQSPAGVNKMSMELRAAL
jgi:hypothetical protein